MTSISPSTNKKSECKQTSFGQVKNLRERRRKWVVIRRAEFLGKLWKKKKKKLEKLDEPRNEKRKVSSNSVATLPPSSLVSPRVNIECKYIPPAGYLGKMKRGEFERND